MLAPTKKSLEGFTMSNRGRSPRYQRMDCSLLPGGQYYEVRGTAFQAGVVRWSPRPARGLRPSVTQSIAFQAWDAG